MRFRIVSSQDIYREGRFDGSYHNAEAIVYDNIIKSHSSHNLNYYCTDIFTSGRNKRAYTSKEFGYPFLSNSDAASQNPFSSCKYNSKKYGYDESAVLKAGMILTGRVGAIGQTSLVPRYWETLNAMGSDNIIRIAVKPEYRNGYIYAYLASKIGNLQFWKHATGGVQPFITDAMVGYLPIPDFSDSFQQKVDDLIQETTRLRANAADALNKAHELIVKQFSIAPSHAPHCIVSSKTIFSSQLHRFDSNYYVADGKYYDTIIKTTFHWKTLGDVSERIWRPDIFKRAYVKNGIPFLSSSDIMLSIPQSEKQISRRMPNSEAFLVDEKWILVPRSGTIGEVVYTTSQHAQKLVSEHVIRIVPNDILSSGYVYAFLSSSIGKALIQRLIFGSVIQHIEPPLLETIPIPILSDVQMDEIAELAEIHRTCWGKAAELELEAISLVESEIEKWNN